MIEWCDLPYLKIKLLVSEKPRIAIRSILPSDDKTLQKSKKKYPFINKTTLNIKVVDNKNQKSYSFEIPKGYCWNGSDIPKLLWTLVGSQHEPQYLFASCLHDYTLEHKYIIGYDRNLTSRIFEACLIEAGVGKLKANIMGFAVDCFQIFQDWTEGE